MPFTISHPAVVLPLFKLSPRWLSLTGLVMGSMVPDFEYFIRMKIQSSISHTWPGLFWFNLPVGLLLTFVFHNLVRDPLYNNLPMVLKQRVLRFKSLDWVRYFRGNWMIVCISILVGASTHLLWDSFTHNTGYFVRQIPFLRISLDVLGQPMTVARVLQHMSTFAGAVVVGIVVYNLPQTTVTKEISNRKYWPTVAFMIFVIMAIRISFGIYRDPIDSTFFGILVATMISALLIALAMTSALLYKREPHDLR